MQSLVSEIRLVPVGFVDRELLDYLALTLPGNFGSPCVELQADLNLQDAYNATRKQYHSTRLLTMLKEVGGRDNAKILGVTEVDLFIPIFTFVFGEAQVGERAALMSTHRLRQQFYGLADDRELSFLRAEKEATHELGHAFGLAHCHDFDCVMHFSNSVDEVDLKTSEFCPLCRPRLSMESGSALAA